MARLFKLGASGPGRGRKKLDSAKKSRRARTGAIGDDWCCKIQFGPYRFKRARLCSDERISEQWANLLQAAVDRRNASEPADRDALDKLPRRLLESFNLVSKVSTLRRAKFEIHVDEYADDLAKAGRAKMYVYNVRKYLKLTAAACGWKTVGDANREALKHHLESKQTAGAAARTLNNILSTHRAFFAWCVQLQRMDTNPSALIKRFDAVSDRRRTRRALQPDEVSKLLAVAGPRELVYRVALASGLRRLELKRLQWQDVQIDDKRPCLMLRAEATKSKRADVLPLSADIARRLRAGRPANAKPTDAVFRRVPKFDTWFADVERAGLTYRADGKILGFHSLRSTFISELQRSGHSQQVIMQLGRHTDFRLTCNTYTDKAFIDTFGAVQTLPTYEATAESAIALRTGTNNETVSKARESDAGTDRTKYVTKSDTKPLQIMRERANQPMMVDTRAGASRNSKQSKSHGKNRDSAPINASMKKAGFTGQETGVLGIEPRTF